MHHSGAHKKGGVKTTNLLLKEAFFYEILLPASNFTSAAVPLLTSKIRYLDQKQKSMCAHNCVVLCFRVDLKYKSCFILNCAMSILNKIKHLHSFIYMAQIKNKIHMCSLKS